VGVQAFDDGVLRLLGRAHDARQARAALALVQAAGVELSVDLMCGVPGQTMASWAETLEEALDAGARHVSVYPLSIEAGTPLAADVAGGSMPAPDPDMAADMMLLAEKRLAEAGIARYEVANYAAPGHESRHNIAYWTGRSYAGIGPGAHGMLQPDVAKTIGLDLGEDAATRDIARVRYANCADIDTWLTGERFDIELLSGYEAAREDVMLGMRLSAGVRADRVAAAGLERVLEELGEAGLVERANNRWRITQRGWLLGNEVFGRIWAGE
jgi:coproporphyrinogen III oxidase-like Fe-S oxidoreductase